MKELKNKEDFLELDQFVGKKIDSILPVRTVDFGLVITFEDLSFIRVCYSACEGSTDYGDLVSSRIIDGVDL